MEQQLIPQGRFDTRFWREDLRAGLILAPLSIAFGIGIAGISLFPSQSGLVSAVVAMMALFLYGGSYIVVCGAAAALAPILATAVIALGQGDLVLGYQRTLAIIVITGPIMYVMGWRRLTQYMAALCAHSVTAGMLAAIAVMLAIGRLGTFTGVELKNKSHGLFALYEFFWEGRFTETVGLVLLVAVGTFAALVILSFYQKRFVILRRYPPQLIVILLLLVVGALLPLGQEYRINIPEDFWSFHRWPDFDLVAMWQVGVLGDFAKGVGTLGLVDPLETVATVLVIDQYDKYRRRSDVNKVVSAMGIANAVSGFAGGMSNIPGGAKSTISAMLGTVTAWASLYGAVAIVLIVVFARETLNLFPLAGLSAVIVFTVMKLVV